MGDTWGEEDEADGACVTGRAGADVGASAGELAGSARAGELTGGAGVTGVDVTVGVLVGGVAGMEVWVVGARRLTCTWWSAGRRVAGVGAVVVAVDGCVVDDGGIPAAWAGIAT